MAEPGAGSCADRKANAKPFTSSKVYFTRSSPQTSGEIRPLLPIALGRVDFAQIKCVKARSEAEMHFLKTLPLNPG